MPESGFRRRVGQGLKAKDNASHGRLLPVASDSYVRDHGVFEALSRRKSIKELVYHPAALRAAGMLGVI